MTSADKQADDFPMPVRHPHIVTLFLASAISPLAINIFIPSMPGMAEEFGTPYPTIQLGLSLYLLAVGVLQLFLGPLSDYFGRRPVLIAGMMLFLAGTAVCISATTVEMFLLGRVIQSASASGMVVSRAVVRDLHGREKAASMIGYVTMGMAIAPMIGPALGGILNDQFGWRSSFLLLGAVGLISLLTTLFDLPETNKDRGRPVRQQLMAYGVLLRTRAFWSFSITTACNAGVFFGFLGGGPVIASSFLGLSATQYGSWFALCALGYVIGNFLSGRFSERIGIAGMIRAGSVVTLLGAILPAILFSLTDLGALALFGPMMVVGIGNGLVLPNATAGAVSVRPDAAGAAAGLMGSFQISIGALTSVIGGILVADGSKIMIFGAFITIVAFAGLIVAAIAASHARQQALEIS